MGLKTSSSRKRKQPRRLRRSVGLRPGELAEVVEDAGFGVEFLVLILGE